MNTHGKFILAFFFAALMATAVSAQDKPATLSVDGSPALVLQVPAAAKVTSSNGYVNIKTTNMSLHVWSVPNVKTTAEALPRAAEVIKSEFIKFKPASPMDIVVAESPAKYVTGSGNEADDGDPGNAEVVLFVVHGRVFAACVHGEFDDASRERAPMMTVLKTAQPPP